MKMKETYKFEDAPISAGFKKLLYVGKDLYGVGVGDTQRKAKIQCAKNGLENLRKG